MMDLALISANTNQLRYILEYRDDHPYFLTSMCLVISSLVLQLFVGLSLIWNARWVGVVCDIRNLNRINDRTIGTHTARLFNYLITKFWCCIAIDDSPKCQLPIFNYKFQSQIQRGQTHRNERSRSCEQSVDRGYFHDNANKCVSVDVWWWTTSCSGGICDRQSTNTGNTIDRYRCSIAGIDGYRNNSRFDNNRSNEQWPGDLSFGLWTTHPEKRTIDTRYGTLFG